MKKRGDGCLVYIFSLIISEWGEADCPSIKEKRWGLCKLLCDYVSQGRILSDGQTSWLYSIVRPAYETFCRKNKIVIIAPPVSLIKKHENMVKRNQKVA